MIMETEDVAVIVINSFIYIGCVRLVYTKVGGGSVKDKDERSDKSNIAI